MIAAPPYILHVWLRDRLTWFSQGTAEYFWQAFILLVMCLAVQRFRLKYLLSFVTAALSGLVIDGWLFVLGGNGIYSEMWLRILSYVAGACITSLAIAFYFRTTGPLSAYELIVVEISDRFHLDKNKVKQINDISMLVISVALAWILTHGWNGVGIGTLLITMVNATLIRLFGKMIDWAEKHFAQDEAGN